MPHRRECGQPCRRPRCAVAELDVAGVPLAVVAEDGHQASLARGLERVLDRAIVALEIRVAVEHEERRPEQRQRRCIAPAVPRRLRPVERIGDLQAKRRAVADRFGDLIGEMAEAEDHPAERRDLEAAGAGDE